MGSIIALPEIRRWLRSARALPLVAAIAVAYALISMYVGGMLVVGHDGGPTELSVVMANSATFDTWNYPAVVFQFSWGYINFPFFATIAMVLVATGVGIGMTIAVLLVRVLLVSRAYRRAAPASMSGLAGLTPAMLALVTLGACCSTAAAATAGVWAVAAVSGTAAVDLLLNNWYLGLFQIVVVWIALVAQEIILRVYRTSVGPSAPTTIPPLGGASTTPRLTVGWILRALLLVGGTTWALSMLAQWATEYPVPVSPESWLLWSFCYLVPGLLAILSALTPTLVARALVGAASSEDPATFAELAGSASRGLLRGVMLLAGLALLFGTPAGLAARGLVGLGNEIAFFTGGPLFWGTIAPPLGPAWGLAFRWAIQYILLGTFSTLAALAPKIALRPLLWTVDRAPTNLGLPSPTELASPSVDARRL